MSIKFMNRLEWHTNTFIVAYIPNAFTPRNVIDAATCCLLYQDAAVITHCKLKDCISTCENYFVDAFNNSDIKEIQNRLIRRAIENSVDDRIKITSDAQLEKVRSKIFDNAEDKAVFMYLKYFNGLYEERMRNVEDRANYQYDFENALEATVPILRAHIVDWVRILLI